MSLFDLDKDVSERSDLAKQMPEKVAELKMAYEKWAKATVRKIPVPGQRSKKLKAED